MRLTWDKLVALKITPARNQLTGLGEGKGISGVVEDIFDYLYEFLSAI